MFAVSSIFQVGKRMEKMVNESPLVHSWYVFPSGHILKGRCSDLKLLWKLIWGIDETPKGFVFCFGEVYVLQIGMG